MRVYSREERVRRVEGVIGNALQSGRCNLPCRSPQTL